MLTRAHKTKLYGRPDGFVYLLRACGLRRLAYNWALAEQKRYYAETGKTLTGYDLVTRFNSIKDERFPWCREFSKWIPQLAQIACWDALKRFFKKKAGFPRFKRKGKCHDSFQVGQDGVTFEESGRAFRLAASEYRFKIKRPIRFPGRVLRTTVSREADGWYCSFLVEIDGSKWSYLHVCETQATCGIDLGITDFCTIWDGSEVQKIQLPAIIDTLDRKIRKAQRVQARRKRGSARHAQQGRRVAALQQRARRVRSDFQHKLTARLVREFRYIGIETLNVAGMLKNHSLARSIAEQAWGQFADQLGQKAPLAGSTVVEADRWFPSSKRCSGCGADRPSLPLAERQWTCCCGRIHDRDTNASQNLYDLAARSHREALNARGETVRPNRKAVRGNRGRHVSMKRESESSVVKPRNS